MHRDRARSLPQLHQDNQKRGKDIGDWRDGCLTRKCAVLGAKLSSAASRSDLKVVIVLF